MWLLSDREGNPPTHGFSSGMMLPNITVPTFDGNVLNWSTFWQQFNVVIYSKAQLNNAEKLLHLRDVLKDGPGRHVIEGLTHTAKCYKEITGCCWRHNHQLHLIHQPKTADSSSWEGPQSCHTLYHVNVDDACVWLVNQVGITYTCRTFRSLPHEQMMVFLKEHRHCINWLNPGHFVKQFHCGQRCRKCIKPHHSWLHNDKEAHKQTKGVSPSNYMCVVNAWQSDTPSKIRWSSSSCTYMSGSNCKCWRFQYKN